MEASERKVAVVSGGGGGIGRAVVLRLAEWDYFPVILDKSEAAGQETLAELISQGKKGVFIEVDLIKKSEVQNTFTKIISDFDRVDLLVNLAGGTLYKYPIQDFPLKEWKEVIDVNLKGTFLCCQAVIGVMKKHKNGAIINTSSNYGITGSATRTAYSAAKAAVIAFSKSLALELAPYGIRVNVIAPGRTATTRVMSHYSSEGWAEAGKQIPMGRVGDPRDIAEGVVFLAGEDSRTMTGQTLHVNGGLVMP